MSKIEKETPAARLARLCAEALTLPLSPGVYLMKNADGKIIYVGKSKALRNRVSQYFQPGADHAVKTARMVASVNSFDYILCDTEMEALALENSLIKLHSPRYNIRLKDDKSYPYIKLDPRGDYPRFTVTRTRGDDGARYFGPFSGIDTAYALLKTAQRMFALPSCRREFPRDIGRERPCLYAQMGQCCAPCAGEVTPEEYRASVRGACELLGGSFSGARRALTEQMSYASDNLMFEAAALYRDRLRALDALLGRQKAVGSPEDERDVVAVWRSDACDSVTVFYIRQGCIADSQSFIFTAGELDERDGMTAFLCELYSARAYIPKEILLSDPLAEGETELCEGFIAGKAGHAVHIRVPRRGDAAALCALARENAEEKAAHWRADWEKSSKTLAELARLTALPALPDRIEVYDISNTGADATVAGRIVWQDGKLKKSEYRVYKIKESSQDDYAAMTEALRHRLTNEKDPLPDLVLLDGGRGHVSVIKTLINSLAAADPARSGALASLPVFGMVKDDYHKTRALTTDTEEISIARREDVYRFIYGLQEEVHRFTVSRMSASRSKSVRRSSLQDIEGIGPARARALLRHFGTIAAVKAATKEQLTALPGVTGELADRITRWASGK